VVKAFKYRLSPNKEQKEFLDKHIGCVRFIYNLGLETKQVAYLGSKANISAYSLMKQLPDLKKELDWLKEVDSQCLHQALFDLDKAYTAFFKYGKGFPNYKSKKNTIQSFRSGHGEYIKLKDGLLKLPKFKTGIKIIQSRPIEGKLKSATITRTSTGKYFVSILCDTGVSIPEKVVVKPETSVGIDLGLNHFIVDSNGKEYENPRFLKNGIQRIKVLQRRMRNKKKGSANQKKAYKQIALQHEKVKNQRTDFLQKLSTQLIRDNQTICCEDLNIAGMVKNRKLAASISDAGWATFVSMLKYKADWYGKNLLQIPTFEASTKVCSTCGATNHNLTLKDREWLCASCGTFHNRDANAAKVIKAYCLRKSGQVLSVAPVELPTLVGTLKQEDI